mgnify:CR=1 FL=1
MFAQSARQYFRAGEEFFEKMNFRDAIEQFTRAVEMDPGYDRAYIQRANAYARLNDYEHAAADYDRAIVFNEKDAELYYLSGYAHHQQGRLGDALTRLEKAIDMKRNYLEAYQVRSMVYFKLQRYQEALEDCRICLRLKEDALGYYNLAQVYDRLEMYREAEDAYRNSLRENDQVAETHFALAGLLHKREKNSEALETVGKMLELDPQNLEGMLLQSRILSSLQNYQGAIEVLSLASIEHPDDPRIYLIRGDHYALMNQAPYAVIDYTKVIELVPEMAEAYYKRAAAYEAIRDHSNALADYEKLLVMSGQDRVARELSAEVRGRIFELNREDVKPQVELTEPESGMDGSVDVPRGAEVIALTGLIKDESNIKSLQVNNFAVPVEKTEKGYRFLTSVNVKETDQIIVQVSDVYDNAETAIYALRRTEVDPPSVQIIAPYGTENNVLCLDSEDPNMYIEGRIADESRIRSIYIDSVSASYIPSDINPSFSAMVNVGNRSRITVLAEDVYGNRSETSFTLNRNTRSFDNNPMGKTWAIFIENSNYESYARLEGPARDITLMKAALDKYQIHNLIHKKDMSKQELERFFAIELRDLIRSNRVNSLMVWYAGHGKYINETGYWIPVDANWNDEFSFFSINALKASMQSYPDCLSHTLVITDACESGPAFYQAMRSGLQERDCDNWEDARLKSSQVFSSAGYERAADNSQFTRTFANVLTHSPGDCIPIEKIVQKVTTAVVNNRQQEPQFGRIAGLEDENGTFFFIPK